MAAFLGLFGAFVGGLAIGVAMAVFSFISALKDLLPSDSYGNLLQVMTFLVFGGLVMGALGVYQMRSLLKSPSPPSSNPSAPSEKRYCRYCGAEGKTDAVYCEKCGKHS